jgi:hypothetical protein
VSSILGAELQGERGRWLWATLFPPPFYHLLGLSYDAAELVLRRRARVNPRSRFDTRQGGVVSTILLVWRVNKGHLAKMALNEPNLGPGSRFRYIVDPAGLPARRRTGSYLLRRDTTLGMWMHRKRGQHHCNCAANAAASPLRLDRALEKWAQRSVGIL